MTDALFRQDAYLRQASGQVVSHADRGVVLDQSVFYPNGGGQPGDRGTLTWDDGAMVVINALKGEGDDIALVPEEGAVLPPVGTMVTQSLDWAQRLRHMRMHTALHLLSVVIPLPVTGGQIGAGKSRLDFAMDEPPEDKQALEDALNALIARDLEVSERWITDAELDANPGLVKTMSVQPPKGAGQVRLVRIGTEAEQIDLQPCGGTHVRRTSEIGQVRFGKVEKKSRLNRRFNIHLAD
ncbi:Ala-tRNA(Pro) hydrolase [Aliiroseovarius sediminilitoris]|uniref:Alanine--tRNA ligase n=1 Tax=Aliiroseovarius sediminilitoris TaxID=1173584 RepID=A0A1I0PBR3_9RHOB|nr:alanyl-tRNA editing protein [Aliiroseovarius sediminilitoris]SEW11844.1 Ala-tRNA(Pro) hydrolase [Aliiroseovarius sediminilitoris]